MNIEVVSNYEKMSAEAARLLVDFVKANPNANLCLPTGGSVEGTFDKMCELARAEGVSFRGISSYNMDEYATLSKTNENGYYYFLNKFVYSRVDIDVKNTYAPEADAADLQAACDAYTERVRALGGFDFILLGIGSDGHIAFNMPKLDKLCLDTHIEDLTEDTIKANARFFSHISEVPRQAVTIGVGLIMQSKKIVLVASGAGKAAAIGRFLNNRVLDPMLPASVLWLHPDVTLILDEAAAGEVKNI